MYEHLLTELVVRDYAPPDLLAATMNYLQSGGPREWHEVAQSWNWDAGAVPLKWVVDQDDADKATILTIFWDSTPDYGLFNKTLIGSKDDAFLFPLYILTRWKSNVFTRQEIRFPGYADDSSIGEQFLRWRLNVHHLSLGFPGLEIPMSMVASLPGLSVPPTNETFWFDRRP